MSDREQPPATDSNKPTRPDPLSVQPENIPDKLTNREAWVCWRYDWRESSGEWTKAPIDVETGGFADITDPGKWSSFEAALDYHQERSSDTDGLGFVVHGKDTVSGIDFDDCRDPQNGGIDEWAREAIEEVPSYAEISPSGTGLRLFGIGFIPDGGNRGSIDGAHGHLEMYDEGRYLTVTGAKIDDSPDEVRQVNDEIAEIHGEYIADGDQNQELPDGRSNGSSGAGKTATSSASQDRTEVRLSDTELIQKAKGADNGQKFQRLWRGDTSNYPSHSEADLALCSLLAFWTRGDRRRIEDLFRQSGLYREKWDRDDYRRRTIDKALKGRSEYYEPSGNPEGEDMECTDTRPPSDEVPTPICPADVEAQAGLDEDGRVSDLTDREKAACLWDLLRERDYCHVRVRRDNGSIWGYVDGIWEPDGERVLRHAAKPALGAMNYGQNVLRELKEHVKADPAVEVTSDQFGLEPGKVAVQNGLLDLEAAANGEGENVIRDLEPEDYALARLPVEYDPEADYAEWEEYVNEWAESGRADMLQEYVGYCLHAGALPIHRALLLVGSGANGKGTFLKVVRSLLGDDNTTSIELQKLANEDDALAEFHGAIANIDDDLSSRKLGNGLGMFKKLIGGDTVRARRLYEDGFEFTPTGKHLYAANEVPDVNVPDDDEAFWRRWIVVEFPHHYPVADRNPELPARLTTPEKLSGVLNWAIEGWQRLLKQAHFTNEERRSFDKRQRWQQWGDSVDKFIAECIDTDPDAPNRTTNDVYNRYTAWCKENNMKAVSQHKLTNSLKTEEVGYSQSVRVGGSVQRGYKQLGFTDEAPKGDGDHQQQL